MSAAVAKPVMSVSEKMAQCKEAGRTALIPFIVAGKLGVLAFADTFGTQSYCICIYPLFCVSVAALVLRFQSGSNHTARISRSDRRPARLARNTAYNRRL